MTTPASTLDPKTLDTVRTMIGLAQSGRLAAAREAGKAALGDVGKPGPVHALLGRMACESGDFADGLDHLRKAIDLLPDEIVVRADLAAALTHEGRFDDVLALCSIEQAKADPTLQLARFRGYAAQQLERFAEAVEAYRLVVDKMPDDAGTWNNLGNAESGLGLFDQAVESLSRAVQLDPASPPSRLNLAAAQASAGRIDDALAELTRASEQFPADYQVHYALARQAADAGDIDTAIRAFGEALRLNPGDADIASRLGQQKAAKWDMGGAEEAYRRAIAIDRSRPEPYIGLALLHEHDNDADQLRALLAEAKSVDLDDGALQFIVALEAKREKDWERGLAAATAANPDYDAIRRMNLIGEFNDRLGRPAEAFAAYSEMNRLASEAPHAPLQLADQYRAAVDENAHTLTRDWAASWTPAASPAPGEASSPVFLLGFPRSGTTLLDTMLMGHPDVRVLEEKPPFPDTERAMGPIAGLADMPAETIRATRSSYWDKVADQVDMSGARMLVDKSPLYLNKTAYIHRLFPDARYILALRHPMDVVLSCFVTNFRPNAAMANFLELQRTADLYDRSMRAFFDARDVLDLPTYTVVYERMVADKYAELKPLFDWLGLDWRDEMVDHQATAAKRGTITTASYAQVGEAIYTRSAGRWTRYRDQLKAVEPILAPWVEKLGYSLDDPAKLPERGPLG